MASTPAARIPAWQCVGCGRIDGPGQCVGICRDVPVEMVAAPAFNAAVARVDALEAALRRIVATKPRAGEWERSYLAMQEVARRALASGE